MEGIIIRVKRRLWVKRATRLADALRNTLVDPTVNDVEKYYLTNFINAESSDDRISLIATLYYDPDISDEKKIKLLLEFGARIVLHKQKPPVWGYL